jgi:hypothetical protein
MEFLMCKVKRTIWGNKDINHLPTFETEKWEYKLSPIAKPLNIKL